MKSDRSLNTLSDRSDFILQLPYGIGLYIPPYKRT